MDPLKRGHSWTILPFPSIISSGGKKMTQSTHVAWDRLAVAKVISELFGCSLLSVQKTTKTLCNKRVSLNSINNDAPTCVACRDAAIAEADRDALIVADMKAWNELHKR